MDDSVDRALANADEIGHLAEPDIGVLGNADQDVAVVGQERPFGCIFDHKIMISNS
jgi:hypothetical protein